MKPSIYILTILLNLTSGKIGLTEDHCTRLNKNQSRFARTSPALNQTEQLTAYFETLLIERVLTEAHLQKFIDHLERGEIINPISKFEAATESSLMAHYLGIERFLKQPDKLKSEHLLTWANNKLGREREKKQEKQTVVKKTSSIFRSMNFVTIDPGTFLMKTKEGEVKVEITEAFIMQDTPVTQWQYSMIMGENPSGFKKGPDSITIKVRDKFVTMQPDHPVENVSFYDTLTFFEKINELSAQDSPILYQVIPSHQKGTKYRLPTSQEWEFAARNQGKIETDFSFGNEVSKLTDYAWTQENSGEQTHGVGQKTPVLINGQPLYDIHGNVGEWTRTNHKIGTSNYVIRGGSYNYPIEIQKLSDFTDLPARVQFDSIGFRLVGAVNN